MSQNIVGLLIRGQYRIEHKLGSGGFADVYLATDTKFGARKVAIKVLLPEFSRSEEDVRRFLDEAKITGNIHDPHRHLIQVYEFGCWDGLYCIVMEYLEGRSLRVDMDRRLRPLAYAEALDVAAQVCEGLAAAHRSGVAHRDLKPDNIFLCPTPYGTNVKVLDLGIAKVVDSHVVGELQHRSRVGVVLGTPAYLAPEVFSGQAVDYYLADVYSLGVVLYEMITGETPFQGDSPAYYVYAHAHVEPMRPSEVNSGIRLPDVVEDLVMRCLAKQPGSRFRSPEELAGQILAILAGEGRSNRRPPVIDADPGPDRHGRQVRQAPLAPPPIEAPVRSVPKMPDADALRRDVPEPDAPRPGAPKFAPPGQGLSAIHAGLPIAVGPRPNVALPVSLPPRSPQSSPSPSAPNIQGRELRSRSAPSPLAVTDPASAIQSRPSARGETAGPRPEPPESAPNETVIGLGLRPRPQSALRFEAPSKSPEHAPALSPARNHRQESASSPPQERRESSGELASAPVPGLPTPSPRAHESESLRQVFVGLMLVAAIISIFTTGTLVLKIIDTSWMHATNRSRPPPPPPDRNRAN